MVQLGFSPKFLFQVERRQLAGRVPEQGRREERQRHLQLRRLVPPSSRRRAIGVHQRLPRQVRGHVGQHRLRLGRGLRRRRRSSPRWRRRPARSTMPRSSRRSTRARWPTVEGNLSWNENGEPSGSTMLRRVDRRQALAGLPADRGAARSGVPEAVVGGLTAAVG